MHAADALLKSARENVLTPSPTIKSYSTTRWNGVTMFFKSILLSKDLVAGVFKKKGMLPVKDRALDLRATLQAAKVVKYACEAHFWTELEVLTPLFKIINAMVTFLEGDKALLSQVLLSFAVIAETLNFYKIPGAIVFTVKKR